MTTKKQTTILLLFLLALSNGIIGQLQIEDLNVMPMPKNIKLLEGQFYLSNDFEISISNDDEKIFKAAQRTLKIITDKTGLFLMNQFPLVGNNNSSHLKIIVDSSEALKFEIDESYYLDISSSSILIKATNSFGAMHALSTLVQLVDSDSNGYYLPNLHIYDAPRFTWRGLLIDVSRHFEPVDVIKRNLDAMAAVKLNVLHWHLTDDHGFRIESRVYPKLHELGSDGLYYTQEEIRDIVNYAAERGIRVVPEFDLPGHATAWFIGYPELASAPGPYEIQRLWGIFDPTFDPTNEDVYIFLEKFFTEMSDLFPDDYWHIGGDENNGHQWDKNKDIQNFMSENNLKDNHALQNYFNERIDKILSRLNKTMVGWYTDEMPDLSKDYIVQAWKGRKTLYETAKNGYRSLLSHGFYIDLVQTTEYHYLNDPIPPDSVLTDDVKELIIGGEATMWAEFVGPETIDSRIWPRTAAVAERLWSPSEVNDVKNMYKRLDKISIQLETYGLTHIKNYDMMLRRIVDGYDIDILKNFVNAIQPLYTYSRDRPHIFKSYYPLTRIVDVAVPDPRESRLFNYNIFELLDDGVLNGEEFNSVKNQLILWRDNHNNLSELINCRPILKEIESLSEDLMRVSEIGLQALDLLQRGDVGENKWYDNSLNIIEEAKKPRGETELAILKSIRKLVDVTQHK